MILPALTVNAWVMEWANSPRNNGEVTDYIARKAADFGARYMRERAASCCDTLRVKGGAEWTESHLIAVEALTEAATAIRALKEGE